MTFVYTCVQSAGCFDSCKREPVCPFCGGPVRLTGTVKR